MRVSQSLLFETLVQQSPKIHCICGMSQFEVTANEFRVFEKGPSVDKVLQWATADQCSLTRVLGGIHPPSNDIRGRQIGIGIEKTRLGLRGVTSPEKYGI